MNLGVKSRVKSTVILKFYIRFKDGKEIKAGDMFNLRVQSDDENSLGTYSCVAINCMGKAMSCAQVTVLDKTGEKVLSCNYNCC